MGFIALKVGLFLGVFFDLHPVVVMSIAMGSSNAKVISFMFCLFFLLWQKYKLWRYNTKNKR